MNKTLFSLVLLLSITSTFAKVHSDTSSNNLQSSKYGTLKLFKDNRGFYALADFEDDPAHADDFMRNTSAPMMIGLYTSQTFLAAKCLSFKKYDCSFENNCTAEGESVKKSYPYFSAEGNMASTNLYLDYNNWILSSRAFIAKSCSVETSLDGHDTYGIIGMGVAGNAKKNLFGSKVFSVYIDSNRTTGVLLFTKDTRYTLSQTQEAQYNSSENWEVPVIGSIYVGANETFTVNTTMVLDLNSDAIGLPSKIFNDTLESLEKFNVTDCQVNPENITCTYVGYANDLPNITIFDGKQNLSITPEIYLKNYNNQTLYTKISLNIKPIESTKTGRYYVTSEYENYIILDSNFMSYYYVVFDSAISAISIYKAGTAPPHEDRWVLALVILVVFIVGIVVFYRKRQVKQASKAIEDSLINKSNSGSFVPNGAQNIHYSQPQAYVQPPQPKQQIDQHIPSSKSGCLCC